MIKVRQSQSEIADKLGVSQAAVSYWLSMRSRPKGLQKKALAEHYPEILERIEEAWKKK